MVGNSPSYLGFLEIATSCPRASAHRLGKRGKVKRKEERDLVTTCREEKLRPMGLLILPEGFFFSFSFWGWRENRS